MNNKKTTNKKTGITLYNSHICNKFIKSNNFKSSYFKNIIEQEKRTFSSLSNLYN